MEIVRIENLSFTYPESKNKALHDINLTVQSGEFILICGESGCGKTTLLKMLKKQLMSLRRTDHTDQNRVHIGGIVQFICPNRSSVLN